MAQQAQRSSIELYTHLFFKDKTVTEDAYIIKIMNNGIVALIPKYGIEGTVKWADDELLALRLQHDAESGKFMRDGVPVLALFQKVQLSMRVEEIESSQRQKLVVSLVEPAFTPTTDGSSSPLGSKRTAMHLD